MKHTRIFIAILTLLCLAVQSFSQEQLGMRLGNYSGIHGTMFNPAFNVNSPLLWDVNILAGGAFAENNYAFIKDANLFKVLRNRSGYSFATGASAEGAVDNSGLEYDFTSGNRRKEAYINVFATGPSAMFHVKDHTFGVFFNLRSIASTNRIPSDLGYYNLDALETGDVLHVNPFKAAAMVWSEIGLNYGRNIMTKQKHVLNAGVTVKFLQGYEGAFFQNHKATDITIQQDFMTYADADVTYGLASGITGYGDAAQPYDMQVRGYGASIDIGAVYYWKSKQSEKPYDWKFGLSLIDFGKISFGRDAEKHQVNSEVAFDFIQEQYVGVENFDDVFELLSTQSLGEESATYAGNRFGIWTPAAISGFAEYAVTDKIFVNAAVVRRLRFFDAVPERDNIWAITPRYESRWFGVSVPVVLFNDKDLRLGTALRMGPVVIGSDNITSWFGSKNFSGSDIYFALRVNPFTLGKKQLKKPTKRGGANDCFNF